jgi:RimJ/RimL family protein N-acetyltransferase
VPDAVVFRTGRLRAVPWRDDHAEPAFAAYSDAEFVRYLGSAGQHESVGYTRDWLRRIRANHPRFWALELVESGEVVGATLCQPLPGGDGEHEIGWHIFPAHQRNGYATEIGRGAAEYGFDVLGLDEILAIVVPDNVASLRVAEAIGMKSRGRSSRYYDMEAEVFALTRGASATNG